VYYKHIPRQSHFVWTNSDTITATTDNQQTYILVTEPLISRHANGQETQPVHSTSHPQVYTQIKPAYLPIGHSCIKLIQQTVHRRSYPRFMATWPCSHHCSRRTIHKARIYIRRKNNLELHTFNIFKVFSYYNSKTKFNICKTYDQWLTCANSILFTLSKHVSLWFISTWYSQLHLGSFMQSPF